MTGEDAALFVKKFETRKLPREEWTHEAHFIMAFWYSYHFPLPVALQKIREGIKAYNISVGGENTDTAGYHETITLSYVQWISCFIIEHAYLHSIDRLITELRKQPFLDKDFLLGYYTKSTLFSTRARTSFVAPDIPALSGFSR